MNTTSRQLQDMMRDHLKQGRNCIYLSNSIKHCHFCLDLMARNYAYTEISQVLKSISFKHARVQFHSTTQPCHTLKGKRGYIVVDHAAFHTQDMSLHIRNEFIEFIHHQNIRYGPQ